MPCSFDARCHLFYVQALLSLIVLLFSMAMLMSTDKDSNAYYIMMSSTLGFWLPQPKLKQGTTQEPQQLTGTQVEVPQDAANKDSVIASP
jgi:hypothetical protein